MREELTAIFSKLGSNATKIAPFSSTRDVESLNTVVPSKDTKSRHYTENKAITGRVNCAVAQKNSGHGYVNKVHQEADLSPGKVLKCMMAHKISREGIGERVRQSLKGRGWKNSLQNPNL